MSSSSPNRTKVTPFVESTIHNTPDTIGGILSCSLTAWTALGPHLRVIDLRTGLRISSWHFGHTIRDYATQVLSVAEIKNPQTSVERVPLLTVGLSSGLVCIYEPVTSRVLRAIVVGAPVTSLAVVDGDGLELSGPGTLLATFDGLLAVGLAGGDVLLLDLCRQSINESLNIYSRSVIRNEERPCEMTVIYRGDLGRLNRLKERAAIAGRHLAYHLNYHPAMDQDQQLTASLEAVEPHFPLQSTVGDVLLFAPRTHVAVSALLYAAPLCSVLVGYSFGCWQLVSLLDSVEPGGAVLYTSLLHRERAPLRAFALQEPSDDPRTCCYVWAVHDGGVGARAGGLACAVMYGLSYERKEWHEGYGWMYERLNSCTIRFQMDLTNDFPITGPSGPNITSHCLSMRSYSLGSSPSNTQQTSSASDDPLELCTLSYATTERRVSSPADGQRGGGQTQVHMLLFDLNQWYLSQMPGEPRARHCDTYMARVCCAAGGATCLDVRLDERDVRPFRMRLRRLEEHFRPDALSYNCTTLTSTNSSKLHHLGTQSHLLHQLSSLGPLALLKPGHLHTQALACGLTTTVQTVAQQQLPAPTLQQQRETLLDVALEQHLQSVLERCASDWADGSSLAVGCAVHGWLLEWAWARATHLKRDLDQTLCAHVFDGNTSVLDNRARVQLDCNAGQLGRLRRLFEHVRALGDAGGEGWMVERRAHTLGAVCRWLAVVRWLLGNRLLPECAEVVGGGDCPFDRIKSVLEKRRSTLNKNQSNLSSNLPTPQLYIDSLIEQELGSYSVINNIWTNTTHEHQPTHNNINKYPPSSLQEALRTYLIQAQIPPKPATNNQQHKLLIQYQHMLFSYLMLDLAQELNEHQQVPGEDGKELLQQQMIAFPVTFGVGLKQARLVQAVWLLDRGDVAQAMEQLVDPSVTAHAPPWLHRCVVVQLLAQAQHRFALLYVQLRRPPKLRDGHVMQGCEADWLLCTLFVRNGRLYDALECARERSTSSGHATATDDSSKDKDDLLCHIWSECLKTGQLNNKFIASVHGLNAREEESLFSYMDRVQYPNRHTMRAIYTLQRVATSTHRRLQHKPPVVQPDVRSDDSALYENMLHNILSKSDLLKRDPENVDSKIDGSVPMSVLIHYNKFMSAKATNKKTRDEDNTVMLCTIRDTCTATIHAVLRRQRQELADSQLQQQRHFRGQKRKLQQPTKLLSDNTLIQTSTTPAALLSQLKSVDSDQYSSPCKKTKHNTTSSNNTPALGKSTSIDTSYQMATPLVRRQRPSAAQRGDTNRLYGVTPSMSVSREHARDTDTPPSILKKRFETAAGISFVGRTGSAEEQFGRGESTTPEVLDEVDCGTKVLQARTSPQRRRSIGRSVDGAAASGQATVRFDISLSTTASTSANTTADYNTHQQRCLDVNDVSANATVTSNCGDVANTTGATSTTTSSTNVTFYSPNNSGSLQTTSSDPSLAQTLNDSGSKKAVQDDDTKSDDYNDDIINEGRKQRVFEIVTRGKSPMRRKPIRELSEEPSVGIRSSPRLRQRRSADRELQKSNVTESFLHTSPCASATVSTRESIITLDTPQHQQNNTTIDTIQSELTPLNNDIESRPKETAQANKSNLFVDFSPQRRSDVLEEHVIKTSSLTTSKCTMSSVDGIEQLHEESVVTVDKEEILSKMETVETVSIAKGGTISNTDVDNGGEIKKSSNYEGFINLSSVDVEYSKDITVEPSDSVEYADVIEENADEEVDIYADLYDQLQEEDINDAGLLQTAEEEPMEVDEDAGDVIEINSSNTSTSKSSDQEDQQSTDSTHTTEDSNSACTDSARSALNRATFLREDSRSTGAFSHLSSRKTSNSNSQRSSYMNEDSIRSADMAHLEDDIDVDASERSSVSDIYLQETEVESNADDDGVSNSERAAGESAIVRKDDANSVSNNENSDSRSLDMNVNEKIKEDDSQEASGFVVKSVSETLDCIEENKDDIISTPPKLNESEDKRQVESFETAKASESVDVLQISLIDNNVTSVPMQEDILCMSLPENDLSKNATDCSLVQEITTEICSESVAIDPLMESVIEEDILVDPDILTVTFNEGDQGNATTQDMESISAGLSANYDNDTKLTGPTRRSARLRKDSTSSVASDTSVASNTADNSKKAPAFTKSKILRKTRRSLSVDEKPVEFDPFPVVASPKPASRSNRRTRSVEALETTDANQRHSAQQQHSWLSTITEEQSLETATATAKTLTRGAGIVVVGEVVSWVDGEPAAGKRQRRSASVDTTHVTASKPKRGRPRKTAESPRDSLSSLVGGSGSPMQTRTRARTNSTSSTKSDSVLSVSRRLVDQLGKIAEKEGNIADATLTAATKGAAVAPKRSRKSERSK